jgi:hypothetical protein
MQDFTYSTEPYIVLNFQGRQDEDELDPTLAAAPPGEEGLFISHAAQCS